jgi:hypothetical protein
MATLAHALLAALKDHGAHEIFGIPGDFVLPLFKIIEESNILANFTLSHEPAVGFASRPPSSVPSQCAALGGRSRSCGTMATGSKGVVPWHHRARPSAYKRLARPSGRGTFQADTRVEYHIGDVDEQIDEDVDDRDR